MTLVRSTTRIIGKAITVTTLLPTYHHHCHSLFGLEVFLKFIFSKSLFINVTALTIHILVKHQYCRTPTTSETSDMHFDHVMLLLGL